MYIRLVLTSSMTLQDRNERDHILLLHRVRPKGSVATELGADHPLRRCRTLGPLLFGLSFRDTVSSFASRSLNSTTAEPSSNGVGQALCIVFFNLFSCGMPSYFAVFGPRLGLRQMAIARYSYGLIGAILPAFLNLVTFVGFCAINGESCLRVGSTRQTSPILF